MFQEKYHQIERMLRACTGEEDVLLTAGGITLISPRR